MEKSEETNLPEATAAADENATNGKTQPHSQQATQTTQPATQTQNNVAKVKSGLDEGKNTPASQLSTQAGSSANGSQATTENSQGTPIPYPSQWPGTPKNSQSQRPGTPKYSPKLSFEFAEVLQHSPKLSPALQRTSKM